MSGDSFAVNVTSPFTYNTSALGRHQSPYTIVSVEPQSFNVTTYKPSLVIISVSDLYNSTETAQMADYAAALASTLAMFPGYAYDGTLSGNPTVYEVVRQHTYSGAAPTPFPGGVPADNSECGIVVQQSVLEEIQLDFNGISSFDYGDPPPAPPGVVTVRGTTTGAEVYIGGIFSPNTDVIPALARATGVQPGAITLTQAFIFGGASIPASFATAGVRKRPDGLFTVSTVAVGGYTGMAAAKTPFPNVGYIVSVPLAACNSTTITAIATALGAATIAAELSSAGGVTFTCQPTICDATSCTSSASSKSFWQKYGLYVAVGGGVCAMLVVAVIAVIAYRRLRSAKPVTVPSSETGEQPGGEVGVRMGGGHNSAAGRFWTLVI